MGNGTNKYVITCFRILNKILFKSKKLKCECLFENSW